MNEEDSHKANVLVLQSTLWKAFGCVIWCSSVCHTATRRDLCERGMAATTSGCLVENYRARLDGFKKSDAERDKLVNV